MTSPVTKLKPSLILYYYQRHKNETFKKAEKKAQTFANTDKFSLILFVTREPNHPGAGFINCIGHYFIGMKNRITKRKINSRTWWGPKDLVTHLCKKRNDLKALINSTGKSPIVLMDISPKCILDKEKCKWDMRRQLTNRELKRHFKKILSYEKLWARIKLVVFSLESSVVDGREQKYQQARELFQEMINRRYGRKKFLSVPFFGMGWHYFENTKYWGAWDKQMNILANHIGREYPEHKKLVLKIVGDYYSKTKRHKTKYR